jgi:hypothetical protein
MNWSGEFWIHCSKLSGNWLILSGRSVEKKNAFPNGHGASGSTTGQSSPEWKQVAQVTHTYHNILINVYIHTNIYY